MRLTDLGQVIATRNLSLHDDTEPAREIVVRIGMPQQFPDSPDYYVTYQIGGIGSQHVKHAGGVDAVQALQLVMRMIGADLHRINRDYGGKLRWEGDEEGDLGFPS